MKRKNFVRLIYTSHAFELVTIMKYFVSLELSQLEVLKKEFR